MASLLRKTLFGCLVAILLPLLSGCGGSYPPDPRPPVPSPLSANNVNLIFVVSEDPAFNDPGDVNALTANLTSRGFGRTLMMASFLQQQVLGGNNVTSIYVLQPMTHPETASNYPDLVPLESVQEFAMLNQVALTHDGYGPIVANSFPLNVSYSTAPLPDGVAPPLVTCPNPSGLPAYNCQGLDFRDEESANEVLAGSIVKANIPGFYLFSAPWETVRSLMTNLNQIQELKLDVPVNYAGPNVVYAISILPSGGTTLASYDSKINPPAYYPELPKGGIVSAPCLPASTGTNFHIEVTGGVDGAVAPAGSNTNETVYFVRHAEAHPTQWWEDGNYVAPGQWRALDLPYALEGKIQPTLVVSIDPAQELPGSTSPLGDTYSYVRTDLTVAPYAIANNLPYQLAAGFEMMAQNPPALATQASNYLFSGQTFTGQRLLVGWEHDHIAPTVNALLATYHTSQTVPAWPGDDYDTVWTVKLDANGNLSVDNETCEGISSPALPPTPPQF